MATPDLSLMNDRVTSFPIHAANYSDQVEPLPSGDNLSVSSSDPSLIVSIAEVADGSPELVFTPAPGFPVKTGIIVTVTDSSGLLPYTRTVDLVADTAPTTITVDETMPSFSALPAAGPTSLSGTGTGSTSATAASAAVADSATGTSTTVTGTDASDSGTGSLSTGS